jgi:hypothetical protein
MVYDWVDDVMAVSVTYVRGLDLQQVGDILHFNWDTERRVTFAEAWELQNFDTGVHAVQAEFVESQRGKWLVLIEPNGYLAQDPNALVALSDADVAISVYWNVNALMQFTFYADGILVRSFDPLLMDAGSQGKPLVEEAGLSFGAEGEPEAAAMTLADRLTSVAVGRDWLLDERHRTWMATGYPSG